MSLFGWCITNDHDQCSKQFHSDLTGKTYTCGCECHDNK